MKDLIGRLVFGDIGVVGVMLYRSEKQKSLVITNK